MKHIKLFENFSKELTEILRNPEIGQYVILQNNPVLLINNNNIHIMENNVGLIENIIHGAYISYEVIFKKEKIGDNLRVFAFKNNIVAFGTKEEMEIKLQAKKYNI